jgi:hypothetical protein
MAKPLPANRVPGCKPPATPTPAAAPATAPTRTPARPLATSPVEPPGRELHGQEATDAIARIEAQFATPTPSTGADEARQRYLYLQRLANDFPDRDVSDVPPVPSVIGAGTTLNLDKPVVQPATPEEPTTLGSIRRHVAKYLGK